MIYLVTRHPGALQWLKNHFDEPVCHINHITAFDQFAPGDCVIGSLPVDKIAALCRQKVRYQHLCIDLPASLRGQELSAAQLTQFDARLCEYTVFEVASDESVLLFADQYKQAGGD